MSTQIRIQETYPYPRERVWRALTDRAAIADWLMPNDFEPQLGHEFEMRTQPAPGFDGIVRCMVTVLEPPGRLAFTWRGGGIDTLVSFTLESVDQGTRLTMVHSGFTGARGWMISKLLGKGWRKKILPLNLPAAVARVSEDGYVPGMTGQPVSCTRPGVGG